MSCDVGHRCGLDLALLWLWPRLATTTLIRPQAWEPPYATGMALEKTERPKKKKKIQYLSMIKKLLRIERRFPQLHKKITKKPIAIHYT